jgi:RNA polymerase sigma-70 factor, ECF subfamily
MTQIREGGEATGVEAATDPEEWVDRYGDGLYRYALLHLGSPDRAADAVQETFLEALRVRDSFAGRSSERTWLIGILRHKIGDQRRRVRREPATGQGVESEAAGESPFDRRGRWRVGPADWGGDPSRAIESREFWDVFGRCLARLPQGLGDAFFLRELDGLDSEEVQRRLGITPANLWKRLHRARMLLRECLESGWFGRRTTPSPLSCPDPKGPARS